MQVGKSEEKRKSECGWGRKREMSSAKVSQKTEKSIVGNGGTLSKTWRTKIKSTGESWKNERRSSRLSEEVQNQDKELKEKDGEFSNKGEIFIQQLGEFYEHWEARAQ